MTLLGDVFFFWPVLQVDYELQDGTGTGFFTAEFFDSETPWGRIEAFRFTPAVCSQLLETDSPPGFVPLVDQ